jgi:hypothetical protein
MEHSGIRVNGYRWVVLLVYFYYQRIDDGPVDHVCAHCQ